MTTLLQSNVRVVEVALHQKQPEVVQEDSSLKQLGKSSVELASRFAEAEALLDSAIRGMTQQRGLVAWFLVWISAFLAFVVLVYGCRSLLIRLIGGGIEAAISELAPALLGVAVQFDYLHVEPFTGRVHLSEMKVCNPSAEPPYTTPYMFCAGEVIVDLDMWKLIFSSMSTIEFQELALKGVHVIYEKPELLSKSSNVADVRDHLRRRMSKPEGEDAEAPPAQDEQASEDATKEDSGAKPKEKKRSFIINRLTVEHDTGEAKIKGATVSLTIPAIKSEDFSKECKGTGIEDLVVALVEKFAESILSSAEETLEGAVEGVEKVAEGAKKSFLAKLKTMI